MLLCIGCQQNEPNEPASVQTPVVQKNDSSTNKIEKAPAKNTAPATSNDERVLYLQQQARESLTRGVDWLLAQQSEDGGWHSQTYGPFKGGAATTSLALYAASNLPPELREQHHEAWQRGWKFLEPGVRKKGFVVCPDGTMDEPVYATALVLSAARLLKLNIEPALAKSMEDFLWNERCGPERVFAEDDPNYGGWDLAGGTGLRGETPGSNTSITRFAVEALQSKVRDAEFAPAILAWAGRVQNLPGDGGFYFHPQRDHEGNKAQWADGDMREKPRSYGTATCDGVLLLAALGMTDKDEALREGLSWLSKYIAFYDRVPGFEDAPPESGWQQGLLFYYLMTSSQVLELVDRYAGVYRWAAIIDKLRSTQHDDGRWQNESARMREDDPLIATSFALVALGNLVEYWSEELSEMP